MQEWQERIEARQEQIEKRLEKVEQQQTEPIKVTRIEVASEDAIKRLDALREDTNILKVEMKGVRADISNIQATQSDHSAFFIEHGQHLKAIEDKQDTHSELLEKLINLAESHDKQLDHIATKTDVSELRETQANQQGTLDKHTEVLNEHTELLKQILAKL